MKILMAGSEMTPLARTGGLGDVLQSLPVELSKRGHDVSVILPYYRCLRENKSLKPTHTGVRFSIQLGHQVVEAQVLEATGPNGIQLFLVQHEEFFDRSGLYGTDGRDYEDNSARFIFFSKAVLELAQRLSPAPDILHVHDWQTALIPVFVKDRRLPFKTVLTIHNLAYQGNFLGVDFNLTNLHSRYYGDLEFFGHINLLKAGILFADSVTTVSERYAREIQTPENGCGLDGVLATRRFAHPTPIVGILNGADATIWNPATDKLIPRKFSPDSLAGKKFCRTKLLNEVGLDPKPRGPVFGMVTRLAEQKGLDILLPLLDRLLADDVRLVILGEGETAYERELMLAGKKHANRFAFRRSWDERLAHLITAGADISLIPSHFEPCGLVGMYSLRYGTVPIAHACGGLYQMIQDIDPSLGQGNGFLFFDYNPEAFWDALGRAKRAYFDPETWAGLVRHAMQSDFSWERAAREYEKIYQEICPPKPEEAAGAVAAV
jgi:starch synthase